MRIVIISLSQDRKLKEIFEIALPGRGKARTSVRHSGFWAWVLNCYTVLSVTCIT